MTFDLIVIGGGAAGFFCAVNAARINPGSKVCILEKTTKLLSKVKISGGGRCNVTHAVFEIPELSKRYPRGQNFVKKAFHQFSTTDTIKWFEERGVKIKKEDDGRMFPATDNSQTIIDCLLNEARSFGVEIKMGSDVKRVEKVEEYFRLHLANGSVLKAKKVCIATGGYPKSSMFDWLRDLGHSIEEPVPSLFTFNIPKTNIRELMGVSVPLARVRVEGTKLEEKGPVLITHWGLSGPAVLRTSAWGARDLSLKNYNFLAHISWVGEKKEDEIRNWFSLQRRESAAKRLGNLNPGIPQRLWEYLLMEAKVSDELRMADLPAKSENHLIRLLTDAVYEVSGKTTYKEEFVTAGGIKLSEVDPSTMMSRKVEGLYFAGEVMDVDGITGGFNFQFAWTSGWIAARAVLST